MTSSVTVTAEFLGFEAIAPVVTRVVAANRLAKFEVFRPSQIRQIFRPRINRPCSCDFDRWPFL